jgi:hypothetical protein
MYRSLNWKCPSEAEFVGYTLLLLTPLDYKYLLSLPIDLFTQETLQTVLHVRVIIFLHPHVSAKLCHLRECNNYIKYFEAMESEQLPQRMKFVMQMSSVILREHALLAMNCAYNKRVSNFFLKDWV